MRRRWSWIVPSLFAVCLAAQARAGGPPPGADDDRGTPVAIDDLVAAAVRRAPTLLFARSDRAAAAEAAGAAAAVDEWQLSASAGATATRTDDPTLPAHTRRWSGDLGLGRGLPTGGQLSLHVGADRETDDDAGSTPEAAAAAGASSTAAVAGDFAHAQVELRHPLLRGLGAGVARADRRRAELAATSATAQARAQAAQLVHDLVTGYWELAYATQAMAVKAGALERARAQLDDTRTVMRAGMLPRSALEAAEYQVALREEDLLRARLDVEDQSLALRQLAGLEIGPREIVLTPTQAYAIDDRAWDLDQALGDALAHDPRVAVERAARDAADVDVRVAADGERPRLDVDLTGTAHGAGASLDEASRAAGGAARYEVTAGLSFSWEIGGAARHAAAAARERRARLDVEETQLERTLAAQVVQAVHRVRAARARVAVADQAITVARDNVRAEEALFRGGRTTNFSVFQRQGELEDAELRKVRAIADYQEAVASLELVTGDILTAYRVDVAGAIDGDGDGR